VLIVEYIISTIGTGTIFGTYWNTYPISLCGHIFVKIVTLLGHIVGTYSSTMTTQVVVRTHCFNKWNLNQCWLKTITWDHIATMTFDAAFAIVTVVLCYSLRVKFQFF
jgi:hypothetical protein